MSAKIDTSVFGATDVTGRPLVCLVKSVFAPKPGSNGQYGTAMMNLVVVFLDIKQFTSGKGLLNTAGPGVDGKNPAITVAFPDYEFPSGKVWIVPGSIFQSKTAPRVVPGQAALCIELGVPVKLLINVNSDNFVCPQPNQVLRLHGFQCKQRIIGNDPKKVGAHREYRPTERCDLDLSFEAKSYEVFSFGGVPMASDGPAMWEALVGSTHAFPAGIPTAEERDAAKDRAAFVVGEAGAKALGTTLAVTPLELASIDKMQLFQPIAQEGSAAYRIVTALELRFADDSTVTLIATVFARVLESYLRIPVCEATLPLLKRSMLLLCAAQGFLTGKYDGNITVADAAAAAEAPAGEEVDMRLMGDIEDFDFDDFGDDDDSDAAVDTSATSYVARMKQRLEQLRDGTKAKRHLGQIGIAVNDMSSVAYALEEVGLQTTADAAIGLLTPLAGVTSTAPFKNQAPFDAKRAYQDDGVACLSAVPELAAQARADGCSFYVVPGHAGIFEGQAWAEYLDLGAAAKAFDAEEKSKAAKEGRKFEDIEEFSGNKLLQLLALSTRERPNFKSGNEELDAVLLADTILDIKNPSSLLVYAVRPEKAVLYKGKRLTPTIVAKRAFDVVRPKEDPEIELEPYQVAALEAGVPQWLDPKQMEAAGITPMVLENGRDMLNIALKSFTEEEKKTIPEVEPWVKSFYRALEVHRATKVDGEATKRERSEDDAEQEAPEAPADFGDEVVAEGESMEE